MKGYGQFCPIAKASEVLGERWTHLVIRELGAGSDLKTMTGVWMGHTSLNTALKTNSIRLLGDSALKKNLGAWLRRNYFAGIKPAQKVPARQ